MGATWILGERERLSGKLPKPASPTWSGCLKQGGGHGLTEPGASLGDERPNLSDGGFPALLSLEEAPFWLFLGL